MGQDWATSSEAPNVTEQTFFLKDNTTTNKEVVCLHMVAAVYVNITYKDADKVS
jgi:hypothetical protein